jgi:hypothetical protein
MSAAAVVVYVEPITTHQAALALKPLALEASNIHTIIRTPIIRTRPVVASARDC